jgi:hypothetical protein
LDTANVVSALSEQVRQLPVQLRRSLTWDRGKEINHKHFTMRSFLRSAQPAARQQRKHQRTVASVLSQERISTYSQSYLNKIALRLNQRPRKPGRKRLPINLSGAATPIEPAAVSASRRRRSQFDPTAAGGPAQKQTVNETVTRDRGEQR